MNISALVDRVEPFCFEFDGEKLNGQWNKWKTQTPSYAKALKASVPAELTEGSKEELAANKKAIREATEKQGEKVFLVDTIISWDLTDVADGEVLPITLATLEQLPAEFTTQLIDYFAELRSPKANPPIASPAT